MPSEHVQEHVYDKEIEDSEYSPDFIRFEKTTGKYPVNLLMGFEMEVDPINRRKWDTFGRQVKSLINKHDWLYAKEDGSVDGCEINSHPFNWNWFVSKRALGSIGNLSSFAKASRQCGFHIHLARRFFSSEHLAKMVYFFYANPDFITNISQRDDMHYCSPTVDDCCEEKVTPQIARNLANGWNEDYSFERYMALNLCPEETVEIRIFQGTINKVLIRAYLEFAIACALYTKETPIEKVSVKGFKKYVHKRKKKFPMLVKTDLLNVCKENWAASRARRTSISA